MDVFSKHYLFLPISGRNRKKSESKITPPTVNLPTTSTVSSVANRPPGPPTFTSTPSTPLSAPLAPPQPQATSKLESSENRKRGPGRPPGSTKQNIEQQRMQQQLQQVSFISVSYFLRKSEKSQWVSYCLQWFNEFFFNTTATGVFYFRFLFLRKSGKS
jgi:hypothetical protein